jgi:hypothetical protein
MMIVFDYTSEHSESILPREYDWDWNTNPVVLDPGE